MGFPIAVGTKSVSSFSITGPEPVEVIADDGTVLVPAVVGRDDPADQTQVFIADNSQELQALLTLSYHDMLRLDNGDCEYTMAELRVQITPLHEPFSTLYRESVFHVRLPCTNEQQCTARISHQQLPLGEVASGQHCTTLGVNPTAIFSTDQQFLTCLIPHTVLLRQQQRWKNDISEDASVVVFQLLKPTTDSNNTPQYPVLPSYIQTTNEAASRITEIPFATNPKILSLSSFNNSIEEYEHDDRKEALLNVCAICDVATARRDDDESSRPSFLLIGCRNGSVMAVSYRPLRVAGMLYERRNLNSSYDKFIVGMDHLTEWHDDDGSTIGRLVVLFNDATACVFRSEITGDSSIKDIASEENEKQQRTSDHPTESGPDTSKQYRRSVSLSSRLSDKRRLEKGYILIHLTETHEICISKKESNGINNNAGLQHRFSAAAQWISGSYLALAYQPKADVSTVAVFSLYEHGHFASICSMETSLDQLVESAHTKYSIIDDQYNDSYFYFNGDDGRQSPIQRRTTSRSILRTRQQAGVTLNYDSTSDCIAICGHLCFFGRPAETFHFACLWNWRQNAQGLTIVPSEENGSLAIPIRMSRFCFANDTNAGRTISHIFSWCTSSGSICIRKEIYNLGILSPNSDLSDHGGLRKTNTLFVSSKAVCYPWVTKTSTLENMEIEWRESIIPKSYITSCGTPRVCAIGGTMGRSIAIAATTGICILSCVGRMHVDTVVTPSTLAEQGVDYSDAVVGKLLKPSVWTPRWYLFGNATDERSFRVVTMSWWESTVVNASDLLHPFHSDDILVAVVEVLVGEMRGFYLSCWSSRNLTLGGQLLSASSDSSQTSYQSAWGIEIPLGFIPKSVDLLTQPAGSLLPIRGRLSNRRATILLADNSRHTGFIVYNLQTICCQLVLEASNMERRLYKVVGFQASQGSIGSPADLFLSSTSFVSDPDEPSGGNEMLSENEFFHAATIGIIRRNGGGLDAMAVSKNRVVAIGQVLPSVDGFSSSCSAEISRYWLGDVVCNHRVTAYGLQLDCFCWIIQLVDGRLLNWYVPFASKKSDIDFLTRPVQMPITKDYSSNYVHQRGISLGVVYNAGTTSRWMQQSSNGTRSDFLVGPVPRSLFGCVIGISQSCKRLHRCLGEDFDKHLFRTDFLDHEVFSPGDCLLYPPAFLPTLYSLFHEFVSMRISFDEKFRHINAHLEHRLTSNIHRDASLMSLEVLILRSVETIAGMRSSEKSEAEKRMYAALVATLRKHTTPFQFAVLFLKLGRQIEPSCFPYLFPLPPPPNRASKSNDTIENLFESLLEHGSASMAVTALPLFPDPESTKVMCAAVFDHCLSKLDALCGSDSASSFYIPEEEKNAAGDIFRYASKLDMPDEEDDESHSETENDNLPSRYSVFCGLPKFLGLGTRNKTKDNPVKYTSSILSNGVHTEKFFPASGIGHRPSSIGKGASYSVVRIASRYILSIIFGCEANERYYCWKKASAISSLLVGETRSCFHVCSKSHFARILHHASCLAIEQQHINHLTIFFKGHIVDCSNQLGPSSSGQMFDLLQVLLGCASWDNESYGLVLISIIIGHVSDRIYNLLEDEPNDNPLWTAYLNAKLELPTQR